MSNREFEDSGEREFIILPIAKSRITNGIDDDTEMFDGELQEAVERNL